jgi:hypothetical protein
MARKKVLPVRFNSFEYEDIENMAKQAGFKHVSLYIRYRCLSETVYTKYNTVYTKPVRCMIQSDIDNHDIKPLPKDTTKDKTIKTPVRGMNLSFLNES